MLVIYLTFKPLKNFLYPIQVSNNMKIKRFDLTKPSKHKKVPLSIFEEKVIGSENQEEHALTNKVLPVMFIGSVIWLLSSLFYGGYFMDVKLEYGLIFGVTITSLYFATWAITILLAFYKRNRIATIMFFVSAWITGIVQAPLLAWASGLVGQEMANILFLASSIIGVFATGGGLLLGWILRLSKIGENTLNLVFATFGILAGLTAIMEWILIMLYGFNHVIFWSSLAMLALIFLVIVWDGMRLMDNLAEGYWMLAVIDIFFDYVIVVVRVFIILVMALAGGKD